ncbi:MAG: FAD-dependent oxidoreductase [Polyangiaceae bacterium]|nr:FAD-dependent oxidoreductase [Polyangiaceae bacterium]
MNELDVLVVGAGPTGLTLAVELARRGISVRIIDKAPEPTSQSRAIVVHARTLEILEDAGIATALIEAGIPLCGATMWDASAANEPPRMIVRATFDELDTRYPFLLSVSQAETERVLARFAKDHGVTVERPVTFERLEVASDHVTAVLTTATGEERVRARYVVGCDGARSAVRKELGVTFEGSTYEEKFLLADVRFRDAAIPTDAIAAFFAAEGLMGTFPMRDGRYRLIATAAPDDEREDPPSLADVQALFNARTRSKAVLEDATWLARFRIHCRQVASYRRGRVFLAGDAAHIHSPAGGQGMNTGMQDANNLAWKLALACRGKATDALLSSYHDERHAIGQAVLRSTDAATRVGTIRNPVGRVVRNHLARFLTSFEFVQQRIVRQVAELTVGYEDSPIVGAEKSSMLSARVGGREDADERPTILAWRRFDGGPKPGSRAPDGHCTVTPDSVAPKRLLSLLDTRRFHALLFDGRAATDEGYARFEQIAAELSRRYRGIVETVVVTPYQWRPTPLPDDIRVLFDVEGDLEARYGADAECLYLLRPDLYVGYRSQPAKLDSLLAHLSKIIGG